MLSSTLVSIIIPVYNVEDCIEKSLRSAFNQTYENIEYLIIDDKGNDASMSIVKRLQNEFLNKNIRIIPHTTNQGLSEARNTGIREATGEFIFFMDSDDQISSDCIECHLNALKSSGADFSDGNVVIVGKKYNPFNEYKVISTIRRPEIINSYFTNIHVCGWNKLIKKNLLISNQIQFEKGMLYEDMIWVYLLCKYANSMVLVPNNTYYYIIRNNSITTKKNSVNHAKYQFDSFLKLLKLMTDEFALCTNNETKSLQNNWLSMWLLKIKSRLITSPLSYTQKQFINDALAKYCKMTSGILKLILCLPFNLFCSLMFIPNILFRKIFR